MSAEPERGDHRCGSWAAVVTTFDRPEPVRRCLDALLALADRPGLVAVIDNSGEPDSSLRALAERDGLVRYVWAGGNVGLPRAIALGMAEAAGWSEILVLDDDTVVDDRTVGALRRALGCRAQVGAATVPTLYDRRLARGGLPATFPWSPTLLRGDAVAVVGRPDARLFFAFDDWDYATRLSDAGFAIEWVEVEVPVHGLAEGWPGRRYLGTRNSVYLALRPRRSSPPVRRAAVEHVRSLVVAPVTFRSWWFGVRGLWHGVLGRLGPPPLEVLAGRQASPEG